MSAMENVADTLERELIPERDVIAILTMLDYLIIEVGRIDDMSARCLVMARKSLAETVVDASVRAN